MQPLYPERTVFENLPSKNTPVNDVNLNKLDYAVHGIDKRVLDLYGYQDRVAESEKNAKVSEENALQYANESQSSANYAKESENNALAYKNEAATSAASAEQSNQESKQNADESATSAEQSAKSEANALLYYKNAQSYAKQINDRIDEATESANISKEYSEIALSQANISSTNANQSENYALMSESYAHGGTSTRENEDIDNSKYYYEQTKKFVQGINGLIPKGTVAFEDLPTTNVEVGWMYNISNNFVSDERFNDGGGIFYGAGNNVFWTIDGLWDVTASSNVTGIKGEKETEYRQGNVNLTPDNIGAVATGGDIAENTVAYTEATTLEELVAGEKISTAFSKIKLAVKNVISIVKLLGSVDISKIGDGTVTGILSTLNTNLTNNNNAITKLNSDLQNMIKYAEVTGITTANGNIPINKTHGQITILSAYTKTNSTRVSICKSAGGLILFNICDTTTAEFLPITNTEITVVYAYVERE